jgi:hypothetical protein
MEVGGLYELILVFMVVLVGVLGSVNVGEFQHLPKEPNSFFDIFSDIGIDHVLLLMPVDLPKASHHQGLLA